MKKLTLLLFVLVSQLSFAQYMIVGQDSISLSDFKKDYSQGLSSNGVEHTIKGAQDFLLLQQLAKEKKADTTTLFRMAVSQKIAEVHDQYFYPEAMLDRVLNGYVRDNQIERSILIFSKQKAEGDTKDYQKIYQDVVSGKVTMESAIEAELGTKPQAMFIKPGVIGTELYDELVSLKPGGYTKLYNRPGMVTFAKLVETRPSLGYLVFGTLSYPNDGDAASKKNAILSALNSGKKFEEVTKEFGTTENEKNNGGAVMGSPTLPKEVYAAMRGKKAGETLLEPILVGDNYFFFHVYQIVPYQLTAENKAFFQSEMMQSSFAQKLDNELSNLTLSSSDFKVNNDFETVKANYNAYKNFKNPNAVLLSYKGSALTYAALKQQVETQFKNVENTTPAQWSTLLDGIKRSFAYGAYTTEFLNRPEIKKELTDVRRSAYSQYIFTDYLKSEVAKNPQWLSTYYNQHQADFKWEAVATGRVAITADASLEKELSRLMANSGNWASLKNKYKNKLSKDNKVLVAFQEGEMGESADIFKQYNVPFKPGVHVTKMGTRTVVVAIDKIQPQEQMSFEESKDTLESLVTEEKLKEVIQAQRAKTKIVVEPQFLSDLEANFKK